MIFHQIPKKLTRCLLGRRYDGWQPPVDFCDVEYFPEMVENPLKIFCPFHHKRLQRVIWHFARKYVPILSWTKNMGWNEVMYKITTSSLIWLIAAFMGVLEKRKKLGCKLQKKWFGWSTFSFLPRLKSIAKHCVENWNSGNADIDEADNYHWIANNNWWSW